MSGRIGSVRNMVDDTPLRYRLLTGPDTKEFCERVSKALDDGYVLHGSPALTFDGTTTYVAQAIVLPAELGPSTRDDAQTDS